jgi:hypothetical protein
MGFTNFKDYFASLANRPQFFVDIDNLNMAFKSQADAVVYGYTAFTNSVPDAAKTKDRRAFLFAILPVPPPIVSIVLGELPSLLGGKLDWVAAVFQRQQAIAAYPD